MLIMLWLIGRLTSINFRWLCYDFSLNDLQGNTISANAFRGKKTLVAFWSLTCPHCENMLEELREEGIDVGVRELADTRVGCLARLRRR